MNVATPAVAATVVVPERLAPTAPVPDLIPTVTLLVSFTTFPNWSTMSTLTVPSEVPAAAFCGSNEGASARWSDATALTVKLSGAGFVSVGVVALLVSVML